MPFFSARGIVGHFLGQVQFTIQKTLKAGSTVAEMHTNDAVVHLAATSQPLPRGTDRMRAALECSRFVQAADRLRVRMVARDHPLAFVAQPGFFPLDRFYKTL